MRLFVRVACCLLSMEELVGLGFCSIPLPGGRFRNGYQQHRAFAASLDRRGVQATAGLRESERRLLILGVSK